MALWSANTVTAYNLQVPLAGNTLQDGAAHWTLNNVGLFLQDTWTVNKQLTVTGGVRIDTLMTSQSPKFNAVASGPVIA